MRVMALTGGIATGKSTAVKILQELDRGVRVFDSDNSVRRLLERPEVLSEISQVLERSVILSGGEVDRALLRSLVFENRDLRQRLEGVLHPKVRKECLEKLHEYRSNPSTTLFVADVPLLYESGFHFGQEFNLVVATSSVTQRIRLKARSHFEDRMITSILQAQLPIMEKVARGDVVFWNEGTPAILRRQLRRFLNSIFNT